MRRPGLRDTLVQMQLSDADACEAALRDALPQDKASFTLLYGKKVGAWDQRIPAGQFGVHAAAVLLRC